MAADAGARWVAALAEVATTLERLGGEGWLVGGCLRDALLGVPVRDVDLAVTCEPLVLAHALQRMRTITIAPLNRDSVRLGLHNVVEGEAPLELDVSPLHGGSLTADLALRDFRVNALALPLGARTEFVALFEQADKRAEYIQPPPSLLDPLGGLADLRDRKIVPASGHALSDDPGRILRAARLAARFGFAPSPVFRDAARAVAPALLDLSGDRLRDELNALLALPRAADGLDLLEEAGGSTVLFPTLHRDGVVAHTFASVRAAGAFQVGGTAYPGMEPLAALVPLWDWYAAPLPDGLPRIVALRWGVLWHGPLPHLRADAPETGGGGAAIRVAAHIKLAGPERAIARKVALYGHAKQVEELVADGEPRRARYFFDQLGDAAVDAITAAAACNAALAVAPVEGMRFSPAVAEGAYDILSRYFSDSEWLIPRRLLTGTDLIRELAMAPGPDIGRMLAELRHAQLDERVRTREEALQWARAHRK